MRSSTGTNTYLFVGPLHTVTEFVKVVTGSLSDLGASEKLKPFGKSIVDDRHDNDAFRRSQAINFTINSIYHYLQLCLSCRLVGWQFGGSLLGND